MREQAGTAGQRQESVAARVAGVIRNSNAHVFGLVGNGNAEFVAALREQGAEFTSVRHEGAAVSAASAAARVAGDGIGVATVTYSPGFLNVLTPLAEAQKAGSPVVVVAGAPPLRGARPWDVDQSGLASALGVITLMATRSDAAEVAAAACRIAGETRRPVILALPVDADEVDGPDLTIPSVDGAAGLPEVSEQGLADAVARIRAADRPVLLAGRGAWDSGAQAALQALGRALGAIEFTSAAAHGFFAGEIADFGIAGGFAAHDRAAISRDADLVIAFGASLNPFTLAFGGMFPNAQMIRVDLAPPPPMLEIGLDLRGDARSWAEAMLRAVGTGERTPWASVPQTAAVEPLIDGVLDPRALAQALETMLPRERTIVLDGGHFVGWPAEYWSSPDPTGFLLTGTMTQSIGLGTGSAIGAAAARPDRLTILAVGDGGALMGLADLPTLLDTASSLLVVVFNDGVYGAEWHHYARIGVRLEDISTEEVDFAGVADACGARGAVVREVADLDALRPWLQSGASGAFLLDCRISRSVIAPFFAELMALEGH